MRLGRWPAYAVVAVLIAAAPYVWHVHAEHRFAAVTAGKVYKSAAIPPEKIGTYLTEYGIRTVIDLRDPGGERDALHPESRIEIEAEAAAVAAVPGVNHVNIPSRQVPDADTLAQFFAVLDDPAAYPVLIHCHHGTGRAEIYSALYRIEYEGWDNGAARQGTRPVTEFLGYRSSFADGQPKGDFLMRYRPRYAIAVDSNIK
ncbi:dual specificity protein phosphatase family protein [Sulfurivermis fontis]|uniref:dual specificity protein phosphatase family protein n=1 Tax=Sulfurivermis fontis TaxID=1972068 RepID=UPI000FDC4D0F|nr:dual specificity protein phosphatase family protein [Sulfurivermis fontis]